MLKNYTTTAIRNIRRHKGFTFINITGLAIGLACCLLIIFYVQFEYSFEKYNENADRIYRIATHFTLGKNSMSASVTPRPLASTLINEFPDVECATKLDSGEPHIIKYGTKIFKEDITSADSNYFKVFTLPLLEGNANRALNAPYQIVISKDIALKFFGDENPIGKVLILDDDKNYTVTGLFDKVPENSDYRFEILASLEPASGPMDNSWLASSYYTFALLHKKSNPEQVVAKFPELVKKYMGPEIEKFLGQLFDDFEKSGNKASLSMQALTELHLNSNLDDEKAAGTDPDTILIIISIGLFILILACINFINLSTARSLMRAREIGIRKVIGSLRKQLVIQFLTESVFMTLISLAIAIGIVELSLPFFNKLVLKEVSTAYFNFQFLAVVIAIILFVGIAAGLYPAFLLSGFKPVDILRNKIGNNSSKGWIRKGLVIFQFVTSISLIIGTLIVYRQLDFIQNKKLGFNKEQVIILNETNFLGERALTFRDEVMEYSSITNGTVSSFLPVSSSRSQMGTFTDGDYSEEKIEVINSWRVDYNYLATMGIELAAGRNFSKDFPTDSSAVIVNEALVKKYGWKNPFEHQLGKAVSIDPIKYENFKIIGVVKDFHFSSLRNLIAPLAIYLSPSRNHIAFRFDASNTASVISFIKEKWNQFAPGQNFSYKFMDESFSQMYEEELRTGKVFGLFSFLAILIACLGLFGLSSYTAQRKTKEIGIRKVHGASIKNVVFLLTKEFMVFVTVAFVIAVPLAYYFMNGWLQDFAYKSEMNAWIFIISGLIALGIALATVSYHAIVSALLNPAKTLKYE